MRKKKVWIVLALVGLCYLYFTLFYKTINSRAVPASTDALITIDVKKITNTILWQIITSPSQWKISNPFKKDTTQKINIKSVLTIPDYIFAFHLQNQSSLYWYVQLPIKKTTLLAPLLAQYNFVKYTHNQYVNRALGIRIIDTINTVLITTNIDNDSSLAVATNELYTQKTFANNIYINKCIDANSHLAAVVSNTNILENDAIIKATIAKNELIIEACIQPQAKFDFKEMGFTIPANPMAIFACTQPTAEVSNWLNGAKQKFTVLLGIEADSLFANTNTQYQLVLTDMVQRQDSAITYSYDDNFNKVQKVITNKVTEPNFCIQMKGTNMVSIFTYLQKKEIIMPEAEGNLFTSIPFAKSYITYTDSTLLIQPNYYKATLPDTSLPAIAYAKLNVEKAWPYLSPYLPTMPFINKIGMVSLLAKKQGKQIKVRLQINKNSAHYSLFL